MDKYVSEERVQQLANDESHICKTCGKVMVFEGLAYDGGHVYADYNCGFGGHNTSRVFVA